MLIYFKGQKTFKEILNKLNTFAIKFIIKKMKKVIYVISGLLSICTAVNAGGLLTNTNQNIAFNPNRSLEKASCHFLMTAIRKTALYILDP